MVETSKLIRVAFWYDRPAEYSGGLNYLKNLLFALSQVKDSRIKPYIFFGTTVSDSLVEPFQKLATVKRTSILDRKSFAWFAHQFLHRILGSLALIEWTLHRHRIGIVSHAAAVYGRRRRVRVIGWIPDFQYLHLPELFPHDTQEGTQRLLKVVDGSDALVLSSLSALTDFRTISEGKTVPPVVVLPFVSQPSANGTEQELVGPSILRKYDLPNRFFFLPNQFWKHKNHAVAFAAVHELKARGCDVVLVCSGNLKDYRVRDTHYIDNLLQFIVEHDLSRNVRVLGQIDYADVLQLMRLSISVLNPSLFEGWSSSVEEARSIGQRLILSSIPVHLEQAAPNATYFAPDNVQQLSEILEKHWKDDTYEVTDRAVRDAAVDLSNRTMNYGLAYERLVSALASNALERRVYTQAAELP